jgi:uncharacterized protein YegL
MTVYNRDPKTGRFTGKRKYNRDRNGKFASSKAVKLNHAIFILDNSGSMKSIRQATVDAFNENLQTLRKNSKKHGIETKVTFVTFDTLVNEPKCFAAPLDQVRDLTLDDYTPDGSTAMLDGVGSTLEMMTTLAELNNPSTTALVIIITDGQENYSKSWTYERVAQKIKALQSTNRWTFTYSGANQDLSVVAQKLYIPTTNTQIFYSNNASMKSAGASRSRGIDYLYDSFSVGSSAVQNFYNPSTTTGTKTPPTDPSTGGTTGGNTTK